MLYRDYPPEKIEAVVALALENSISTCDGIKHMLIYSGTGGEVYRSCRLAGKTHLATAPGLEVCRKGIRTPFVTGGGWSTSSSRSV